MIQVHDGIMSEIAATVEAPFAFSNISFDLLGIAYINIAWIFGDRLVCVKRYRALIVIVKY